MRVGDEYRTNPLSLRPGGSTVTIVYDNGRSFEYDKVKRVGPYIKSIHEKNKKRGNIVEVIVNGTQVWKTGSEKNLWEL